MNAIGASLQPILVLLASAGIRLLRG